MTVCNMSIEGGARAGMIAPDEKTFAYLKGRPHAPKGEAWDAARGTIGARSRPTRARITTRSSSSTPATLPPIVTWGTSPEDVVPIAGASRPVELARPKHKRARMQRALDYMGLKRGDEADRHRDRPRLHRLLHQWPHRGLARSRQDRRGRARSSSRVNAMVVPGSGLVKEQAEAEGLDKIFLAAGFEWREPGCSMCLAMNPDRLARANAAPRHPTAISKAVRVSRAALISSPPPWRRRRRSRGISSICAPSTEQAELHGRR